MYCILYSKVCSNTYMYPGSWADATAHTLYVVLFTTYQSNHMHYCTSSMVLLRILANH